MNQLQEQFIAHMDICITCNGPNFKRCFQMRDLIKALATPNDLIEPTVYAPEPQIDQEWPQFRLVSCFVCGGAVKLERRGGINALGFFVEPFYVESRPEHVCFYNVPVKEPVKKSPKRNPRAPVAWSKVDL